MQISATELAEKLRSPTPPHLLDVRQPEEHAIVSLSNATLIPLGQLPGRANEIAKWKNEEVVVYCHHGVRSMLAIAELKLCGFHKLLNLSGGIDAWSVEVDPSSPRY